MRKFTVVYELDQDGAWNASIPEVPGCRTWGRSLEAAQRYIREALASCVDVLGKDADRIAAKAELVAETKLPSEVRRRLKQLEKARGKLALVEREVQIDARAAARAILAAHVSSRDAGKLLGLSHEGVRQLGPPKQRRRSTPPGAPSTARRRVLIDA